MILRTYSPALFSAHPFQGLQAFDRLFDRLHFPFAEVSDLPVEVVQTEKGAELAFEVPGVEAKDVKVEVEGRTLTVTVERSQPARAEGTSVVRAERLYGVTSRSLELPFPIDREAVGATLRDGILTVTADRAPEARPVKIEVRGN